MAVSTTPTEDDPSKQTEATATVGGTGTSLSLTGAAVATDSCAHCGAELAPDQRYCVECGTRRGGPRFVLQQPTSAPAPAASSTDRGAGSWSRAAVLAVLVALLLAVGIGVLIGNVTANGTSVRVVPDGSAGTTQSGSSNSSSTSTGGSSGKSGTGGSSSSTVKPGGSCSKGTPGCVNGKETGNFFGS